MPPDLQWVAGLVEPVRLLRSRLDQYFHLIWHCNEKAIGYYLLGMSNNLSCIHADGMSTGLVHMPNGTGMAFLKL